MKFFRSKEELTTVCDRKRRDVSNKSLTRRKTTNRSSASSIPSVYSSTDSDSLSNPPESHKKPIRRRRQKRKVRQNSSVTKTVEIEGALAGADRDKLVQLAVCQLGLLSDKVSHYIYNYFKSGFNLLGNDKKISVSQIKKYRINFLYIYFSIIIPS